MIIYQKRHLKGTPELNKKYHAFVRLDYPHWSYVKICLMSLLTLYPVRFVLGVGIKVIYVIIAFFAMLGTVPGAPLARWRYNIMAVARCVL